MSKLALESGVKQGVEKEKREREKMSKLIENQAKAIQVSNGKIALLEKQLKEGRTPQTAGFDYEKEVIKLLTENFPEDEIRPTGKKGDAIQYIKNNGENIGSILYECKKTATYQNSFINEVKRHQEEAKANYAVIVTHAIKEGKSKFFIEDDIIIIDPMGLLDIAFLLRNALLEMHKLKLTKDKLEEKGKAILKYMQTGEFRIHMSDAMSKAEDAYNLMLLEIKDHNKNWMDRYKIYCTIHNNVQTVRMEIGKIITGNSMIAEAKELPQLPISH